MAPNRWDPASRALLRPLRLPPPPRLPPPRAPLRRPPRLRPRRRRPLPARLALHPRASAADAAVVGGGRQGGGGVPGDARHREGGGVRAHLPLTDAVRGHGQVHPLLQLPMDKILVIGYCTVRASIGAESLKCSPGTEDFQSRTPPIRERKRKHSNMHSVRVKLETKFAEDKLGRLEDPGVATGTSNDMTHLETDESLSSLPSVASETGSACDPDPSELSLINARCFEDCIGDFPTLEELANIDEDFLAKRCKLVILDMEQGEL